MKKHKPHFDEREVIRFFKLTQQEGMTALKATKILRPNLKGHSLVKASYLFKTYIKRLLEYHGVKPDYALR